MAAHATLAHGFMFEDKGTFLCGMTLEARIVRARHLRPAALDGLSLVRIVAVTATHFAFGHRVVKRQVKTGADF